MKILQKLLSSVVIVTFLATQVISVSAQTPPTPPPVPVLEATAPTPPPAPSPPSVDSPSPSPSPLLEPSPSPSPIASGNVGETDVSTGDATSSVAITSLGNTNIDTPPPTQSASGGSNTIANTQNTENLIQTNQNNVAVVNSDLNLDSTTGKNSGSYNVGNTELTTGTANASGTIITAANTNVAGVSVSEFNVNDNYTGDIILGLNLPAGKAGPGGSTSNVQVIDTNTEGTFQNNDGTVGNNLTLAANSGDNKGSYNTGGNTSITTGNANVAANVLTFLNNNLAGNIIYGVVNIFGNLVGDIILPELANIGNGPGSANNITAFQTNNADIENNLILSAQTGDNNTSYNTGGNSSTQTGEASVNTKVLNIANSNITGGNYWLLIINKAGEWIGKIIGAPEGATMAGSQGTNLSVNEKGEVVASVGTLTNTTTEQSNNATVKNNINLSANTGGNSTNYNTGGSSTIKTGDANIIANLVNFVNNNITGGGKLFVTFVNVFGSWVGDFVTPGAKKSTKEALGQEPKPAITETAVSTQGTTSTESNQENSGAKVETEESNVVFTQNVAKVAGVKIFQDESTKDLPSLTSAFEEFATDETTKNTVNINLAWLLVILPIVGITYWVNLKIASRRGL